MEEANKEEEEKKKERWKGNKLVGAQEEGRKEGGGSWI